MFLENSINSTGNLSKTKLNSLSPVANMAVKIRFVNSSKEEEMNTFQQLHFNSVIMSFAAFSVTEKSLIALSSTFSCFEFVWKKILASFSNLGFHHNMQCSKWQTFMRLANKG